MHRIAICVTALFAICGSGCDAEVSDAAGRPPVAAPASGQATTALVTPSGTSGGYTISPTVGCYGSYGAVTSVLADGTVSTWGGVWNCPVSIEVGAALTSIAIPVRDNGASNGHASDVSVVTAGLVLQTPTGESTLMSAVSAGTGLVQTLSLTTAAPHTMSDGEALVLRFSPTTMATPPTFALWPSAIGVMRMTKPTVLVVVPASAASAPNASGASYASDYEGSPMWSCSMFGDKVTYPISLVSGSRVASLAISIEGSVTATRTFAFRRASLSTAAIVETLATGSFAGQGVASIQLSPGHTIASGFQYWGEFVCGMTGDKARAVAIAIQ